MKTFAVLLPVIGLAVVCHAGQTNQISLQNNVQKTAPAQPANPSDKTGFAEVRRTNSVNQFFRAEKTYGGVLPELRKRETQFFKAPPPPGGEFHNVSINPITGQADGIILFSIKF